LILKKNSALFNRISLIKTISNAKGSEIRFFLEIGINFKIKSQIYLEKKYPPESPGNPVGNITGRREI